MPKIDNTLSGNEIKAVLLTLSEGHLSVRLTRVERDMLLSATNKLQRTLDEHGQLRYAA